MTESKSDEQGRRQPRGKCERRRRPIYVFPRQFSAQGPFTLLLLLVFLIGIALSGLALYRQLEVITEDTITSNGLQLLQSMNAIRAYTSNQIDPLVNPLMSNENKFIPQSVPAFSARSTFDQLHTQAPYNQFIYKEASDNPTAPQDKADAFETGLLMSFRNTPTLPEITGFRTLNGQLMFYNARPMTVNNPSCLTCHSTPQAAPPGMVQQYGSTAGFGWTLNQIIAAQVVYVPASRVFSLSRSTWVTVMIITGIAFVIAVLAVNFVLRRSVVSPISQMANLAQRISSDEVLEREPEDLAPIAARRDELGQMARVFQRMAHDVYAREQSLKQELQTLRMEIDEARKANEVSAVVDTDTFRELKARAQEMRMRREKGQGSPEPGEESGDQPGRSDEGPGPQSPPPTNGEPDQL